MSSSRQMRSMAKDAVLDGAAASRTDGVGMPWDPCAQSAHGRYSWMALAAQEGTPPILADFGALKDYSAQGELTIYDVGARNTFSLLYRRQGRSGLQEGAR